MSVSRDTLPVGLIDPDPDQPRRYFDPAALAELAESMRTTGLAERILVRPAGTRYTIVVGERRWRAAVQLGWSEIPADAREIDPADVPYLQLAENITRSSLSPMEEARAFRALIDAGETQQSIAARLGKDRSYVAQKLRLLDMPAPMALLVDRGALSEHHARQLLRIKGLYADHTLANLITDDAGTWKSLWGDLTTDDGRRSLGFVLLRGIRPEDWAPGYPFEPRTGIAQDAIGAFCEELDARGRDYPRWAVTALYFAVLAVEAKVSVANLDRVLDAWIERLTAAAVHLVGLYGCDQPPADEAEAMIWWGCRSDLRHAGLDRPDDLERLAFTDGALRMLESGSLPLPSSLQKGAPQANRYRELVAARVAAGGQP